MKIKYIILLFFSTIIYTSFAQDQYEIGFKVGYKEGYCYNDYGCITPIIPITPIRNIGEDYDNYTHGYNRGFKMGLEDKQRTKSNSNNNFDIGLSGKPDSFVDEAMQNRRDAQARQDRINQNNQDVFNHNKEFRNEIINWIFDLKTKIKEQQFLDAMDNYYRQLRAMDSGDFGKLGNELDKINFSIKEEIDRYNNRIREAPAKYWASGIENLKKNKYNEAIKDFTSCISLSPHADAYLNRGFAYQRQGNYALSLEDLNKSIEMKNDNAFAYNTRAWAKYYLKDLMGSLSDFNKQIELEPNSAYAYYGRGQVKSKLNDENGAITDYTKSIELKPDFSMAYNNRGWSKYEQKKYTDALNDINKAIELDATNSVAFDSRQEIKFALNDYKGCIEDCNIAISLNPKLSNSYLFRGKAYFKQGDKIKACENWSKAGELGEEKAYQFIKENCR